MWWLSAVNGSLRCLRAAFTIRRLLVDTLSISSVSYVRFRRRFRISASPLATDWLPWVGFPAFNRYYGDAKTASALLLIFVFDLGYLGVLIWFAAFAS
jgi:hypothetical protein